MSGAIHFDLSVLSAAAWRNLEMPHAGRYQEISSSDQA